MVTYIIIILLAAADCGVPLVDSNAMLDYNSTLDGSVLTLTVRTTRLDLLMKRFSV